MLRKQEQTLWFFFTLLLITQIILQLNSPLHHDLIWSLEVGKRLMAGGTYFHDFFETNPPLLYFLHGALFKLAGAIQLKPLTVFYIFIICASLLCYLSCFRITRNLFPEDKQIRTFLLTALAISLGFAPNNDYGQKEHIMMLLALPYFLFNLSFILNKPRSKQHEIVLGALAGIGFAFKPPYFFIPLALIELERVVRNRSFNVLIRWDIAAIVCVQFIYLLSMVILTPSYLTDMLPVILKTYVPQAFVPWSGTLLNHYSLFFYFNTLIWFLCYQPNRLNQIIAYFFLITLGFTLSFILQNKGWAYQQLPLRISNLLFLSLIALSGLRKFKDCIIQKYVLLLSVIFLITTLFLIPSCKISTERLSCFINPSCSFNQMTDEIRAYTTPNDSFFSFSSHMQSTYFAHYGHLQLASRFAALWPLPNLLNKTDSKNLIPVIQALIAEDFVRNQPQVVFVSMINEYEYIQNPDFNYLSFMKENKTFDTL